MALEEPEFQTELSHGMAKHLASKYSHLFVQQEALQEILEPSQKLLQKAKEEALKQVETKVSEELKNHFDNAEIWSRAGLKLKQKYLDAIKSDCNSSVRESVREYCTDQKIEEVVKMYVDQWLQTKIRAGMTAAFEAYVEELIIKKMRKILDV